MGEFSWIEKFFQPLTDGISDAHNLKDDAATLSPPPHHTLVLSSDTSVENVHFLKTANPREIASKSFLSALSDLIAKGANPHAYLMNFGKPTWIDELWMEVFSESLHTLQKEYSIILIGGDTTQSPGPLTISYTMIGYLPANEKMILRSSAQEDDLIYVTGTIGDSGLFLKSGGLKLPPETFSHFQKSHYEPNLPFYFMKESRHLWNASIDVSDGLIADIYHMAKTSGLCALIDIERIPLSDHARTQYKLMGCSLQDLATLGEDFQLALAIRPQNKKNIETRAHITNTYLTCIGRMTDVFNKNQHVIVFQNGAPMALEKVGYTHF